MQKQLIVLCILAISILSCKKKKEEQLTADLKGSWKVVTLSNGTLNPYDTTQTNQFHAVTPLNYNDSCGNLVGFTQTTHLTEWYLTFQESGTLIDVKINNVTTLDEVASAQAPCGTPIYKMEETIDSTNSEWTLDGKKLFLTVGGVEYMVEEISDTRLVLSNPGIHGTGQNKIEDVYEKR